MKLDKILTVGGGIAGMCEAIEQRKRDTDSHYLHAG
jgi:protoporphyrinogen oxidase